MLSSSGNDTPEGESTMKIVHVTTLTDSATPTDTWALRCSASGVVWGAGPTKALAIAHAVMSASAAGVRLDLDQCYLETTEN
jgi:hypothetical protein